jgi:hypothetical protein
MTYATSVTGPFYHGTRADLAWAICSRPGCASHSFASTSNYADRKLSWICFSGGLDAAIWERGSERSSDRRRCRPPLNSG